MSDFFTIDTSFLHQKLAMQILNPVDRGKLERKLQDADLYTANLKEIFLIKTFTDSTIEFLTKNKILSLEEKLLRGDNLKVGELVWFQNNFYFKGIIQAKNKYDKGIRPSYSDFHINLNRYNLKVKGKFNFEHTFGSSSLDRISGQKNKFIFGFVDELNDDEIVLRPIIIGDKILNEQIAHQIDSYSLQLRIDDIDEFKDVTKIPYSDKSLDININKSIPEKDIKRMFAEILNEGNVTKDWGGETSDLFTNHIHINGKRMNAAFVLKGPSKFHEMSIKDLGANGNQIVRLFDEPAEVYFVQHCHYIKQEIYKTMEAFSAQFHRIRRYCVIDGIDTLRILKAYNKI